jgi:hypothetical protein
LHGHVDVCWILGGVEVLLGRDPESAFSEFFSAHYRWFEAGVCGGLVVALHGIWRLHRRAFYSRVCMYVCLCGYEVSCHGAVRVTSEYTRYYEVMVYVRVTCDL